MPLVIRIKILNMTHQQQKRVILQLNLRTMENPSKEELFFWLQTTFQNQLEVSLQLSRSPAPQQTPFVHKYAAIQQLKGLLSVQNPYSFIVHCFLGEIYNDVQQTNDSVNSYQAALANLVKLPSLETSKYYLYLILTYNNLGLSYLNRDENDLGLGCLLKAVDIYEAFREIPGEDVYHNRSYESKGRPFKFYYQGGNDYQQVEDNHTLTLFYLAQTYTKMGFKDKAAQNCGYTLQRQHTTGKYELKEFVNNLIGLAEYYQGNKYFAQAQYLLMLALEVIPEGKKAKLRATVHISIGNLIAELLQFGANRISLNDIQEGDNKVVSKELILFDECKQAFPQVVLPKDMQSCKSLFRQANTQFKKALDVFVLDGYVTEHIEILFSQSRLYKSLAVLEKSPERKMSMLEKRREMLQHLLRDLNPKAYPATWQKILVEVSEIINDLFTLKIATLASKGFPSDEKINASCELGKKSIGYYKEIIETLLQDSDTPRNQQYFRSIVNSKINIAKATSKLMSSDRKKRVQYLKESWQLYKSIIDYVKAGIPEEFRSCFDKEIELTRQMIAMMPAKIDRVNYGQLTFVD